MVSSTAAATPGSVNASKPNYQSWTGPRLTPSCWWVFDGIPLGTSEVAAVVEQLAAEQLDRYRAILDLLMEVTIANTGKRGNVFDPERVKVVWRQ